MPKDGKKSKKEKKDKPAGAAAPAAGGDDTGSKASKRSKPKGTGRAELGGGEFMAEVARLRDSNLAKNTKKEEGRKQAKSDLKQALETTLQLLNKGLKMCNTDNANSILENCAADAEKLKIQMGQDDDYVEEVRFKHNKLNDLLDETRAFTPQQLQKDLIRNRDIRSKCSQLIRGDSPVEQLVNPEELLELVKVRNSIRLWFGGANMAKAIGSVAIAETDEKSLFVGNISDLKFRPKNT